MAFNRETGRYSWDEPEKEEQIRDGQGKLLGYIGRKNEMGVRRVVGKDGQTLGFSKDKSDQGGLPYTMGFGIDVGRVSHGENPMLLFGVQQKKEEEKKRKIEEEKKKREGGSGFGPTNPFGYV